MIILVERKLVEELAKENMSEAFSALEKLNLTLMRYVEQLQQSPATRKAGKGKDERLTDILAAAARGQEMLTRAEELAAQDKKLLEESADDVPGLLDDDDVTVIEEATPDVDEDAVEQSEGSEE